MRKLPTLVALLALALAGGASAAQDIASRLANASAERGKLAFHTCTACHSIDKGAPTRIGPNLWGVVGRPVASAEGFDYSPALRGLGGTWTFQRLDAFLTAPLEYAPGTHMVYPGVDDPGVRAALIEFLRGASDSPMPAPETTAAAGGKTSDPFGSDWPDGPGRDLTGFTCQACHSLAIVKQQGLPRRRWDEMLHWMVEEQGMDPLEPADRQRVLDYLSSHFGIDR